MSIGLLPSWQPPGRLSRATPQRASSAPMNMTDERISSISECGIVLSVSPAESMYTSFPSCSAVQPRCLSIRSAASTSLSCGTLVSSERAGAAIEAAIIGREAFFEPWTKQVPSSLFPPRICQISIINPPHIDISPSYAGGLQYAIVGVFSLFMYRVEDNTADALRGILGGKRGHCRAHRFELIIVLEQLLHIREQ